MRKNRLESVVGEAPMNTVDYSDCDKEEVIEILCDLIRKLKRISGDIGNVEVDGSSQCKQALREIEERLDDAIWSASP